MKKVIGIITLCLGSAAWAEVTPTKEGLLLAEIEPKLNAQERRAVEIAQVWRSNDYSTKPIEGADGSVTYYYGDSQPVLVCAPMEICTIKLEPGEQIQPGGLHAGDSIRWNITPTVIGTANNFETHIIIKPEQVGLVSSLYIGTNRRAYNIKLKSSRTKFMPWMAFIYPQNLQQALDKYDQMVAEYRSKGFIPAAMQTGESHSGITPVQYGAHIESLNFNYKIKGRAHWKPERVYNDGVRTVIHMPAAMEVTEAPSLLVIDSSGEETLVNYRLKDRAFVVDQIFDEAILVVGVGRDQQKVTIKRI
ncbi:P-type conjugative transfer protein TrbG [Microbulbifer aggregans]|uniref:P-type conjugative transfer protein TrbG n=1 Tax=Microbulbifer aggregans TaxID=1769779 RepID=UPI001CFD0404|nr:P-type conjugative transfer protein TrbG [Microbulbifer aggregans]